MAYDIFSLIDEMHPRAIYENIVLYGAAIHAYTVLRNITINGSSANIYVAISETVDDDMFISGYRIYDIHDLAYLSEKSIVILAARATLHDAMEMTARSLGFEKIIRLNDDIVTNLQKSNNPYDAYNQNEELKLLCFLQYQTLNQLRLARLRDKVAHGPKAKVLFILSSVAKFTNATVYRALANYPIFEVSILCFCEYYDGSNYMSEFDEMKEYCSKLSTEGYNAIWGYDDSGYPLPMDDNEPDIVIYNFPYLCDKNAEAVIHKMLRKHLACYIPYGMYVANEFEYHFENNEILPAWIHFIDTKPAYFSAAKNTTNRYTNNVLSGHPMLDDYVGELPPRLPAICQNGNKTVVYAPHWSINSWNKTSSFHIYYQYFYSLLDKYPNTNFVFKPHPRLRPGLAAKDANTRNTGIDHAGYIEFCENWAAKPNGAVVMDNSFMDLFRVADCLITDSYTFIVSWLPADKPCIVPMNPHGPTDPYKYYYPYVKQILESYYLCKDENEIDAAFTNVVIDGIDEKSSERTKQKDKIIYNLGHAGEFIADYIFKQITE